MTRPADVCPHGDKPWRCPTCCLAELRRKLPRVETAVRVRDKTGGGSSGGVFGSRIEINTDAFALLQDIRKAGGLDKIEADLNTLRAPRPLNELRRTVRQWRSRCDLILRDATAPFPLTWDVPGLDKQGLPILTTKTILCPVVNEHGDCGGELHVHRDDDPKSLTFSSPDLIRCRRNDDHEWTIKHGGWLRLGVLLGGVA